MTSEGSPTWPEHTCHVIADNFNVNNTLISGEIAEAMADDALNLEFYLTFRLIAGGSQTLERK